MKHDLRIDYETFSSEPIAKSGLYRYMASPDFEILLCGYSLDGADAVTLDLSTSGADRTFFNTTFKEWLFSPDYVKHAWNAKFEIEASMVYFHTDRAKTAEIASLWRDSQLHGLYCGYPASLDACGKAMGLPEDKKKLATGKALIKLFSCPRKPTDRDARTRVSPADEPEKWKLYKEYNTQDVVTEAYIDHQLDAWPVPDWVQRQWVLDLVENERGVYVDTDLVHGARSCSRKANEPMIEEARQITGLENPNSVSQLKPWIEQRIGHEIDGLSAETITNLLNELKENEK